MINSRQEWNAIPPKSKIELKHPVSIVIIHHTAMKECFTKSETILELQTIQKLHMEHRKWDDIGYNYMVDGKGNIFEGRGKHVGAHAKGYNSKSIGICALGYFEEVEIPKEQIEGIKKLISILVENKELEGNCHYIVGHRDVGDTLCPGKYIYNEIKTWENYGERSI